MSLNDESENVTPISHALSKRKIELMNHSTELEQAPPQDRDDFGYTSALWSRFSLPYKDLKDSPAFFERKSHDMSLVITPAVITDKNGNSQAKYPYGVLARQILLYITTQAKKQGNREIYLGESFNEFIELIGASGGGSHNRRRVQDQLMRLLKCSMQVTYTQNNESHRYESGKRIDVAQSYELWLHDDATPGQQPLFGSKLLLSEQFFYTVIAQPLPIDVGALKALSAQGGAAMRIDIFIWLTARMYHIKRSGKNVLIPWASLKDQFGVEYSRDRDFKRDFLKNLESVLTIYSKAQVATTDQGLLLKPSELYITEKEERRILEEG
ncbi:replication protein RepA [Acaricomes phytoseiuli]|uniref:replication protein RepA n=1 Tax=Acaricomes phytoseiuli TaxID=291968 RepID=UPI0003605A0F|nr:replication protein RepA [Acaricomes phytoseiuli]